MSTGKVAVSGKLVSVLVGINDDAFNRCPHLARENLSHPMRCFTERNRRYAAVGFEVIQVIAHAQHATLVVHLAIKSLFNAGFR